MIYYIRFLKLPKISTVDHARSVVKALITVTSDLGECIYPADLSLWVTLFSPGDDQPAILSTRDFVWKRGMRCLSIEIDQRQIPMATWAARMLVTAHRRAVVDALSSATIPDFVSAWSDSFDSDATQGNSQWVMRRFEPREGIVLNIREDTGESIARHVWDGGIALAACLSSTMLQPLHKNLPESLKPLLHLDQPETLNVIELGSGCGLVGIALASVRPKCRILLTDLADAMNILDYNVSQSRPALDSTIAHMVLDWDDELPSSVAQERYGLIVVSECTYNENSIPALVRMLSALAARSPSALVVVATKVRHFSEAIFFILMSDVGFIEIEQLSIPLSRPQKENSEEMHETVDVHIFRAAQAPDQPVGTPGIG
ncbi:hypothetical protein MMC22_009783 [Lobaria immixta]|nr:hypothetical protein [Lobaria immixta]